MSTIKTTNLQHPSAGSPNLTLASSGAVTINGSMTGAGLDHITTQNVSSVSSLAVDNVFSSNYDSYRLVWNGFSLSTAVFLNFQFRASGSTESSANYYWSYDGTRHNNTSFITAGSGSTSFPMTTGRNNIYVGGGTLDLFDPNKNTRCAAVGSANVGEANYYNRYNVGCVLETTTQYDGFAVTPATGTFSINLSVYGYKNS